MKPSAYMNKKENSCIGCFGDKNGVLIKLKNSTYIRKYRYRRTN